MRIEIIEGVTLEGSRKTCERVAEAMKLTEYLKTYEFHPEIEKWCDYWFEVEYCSMRAELLLGLVEENEMTIECFGKI